RFTSVIFDLDGTLIDSRAGIEESLCAAGAEHGRAFVQKEIRRHIGPPVRAILTRLLPDAESSVIDAIAGSYRKVYDSGGCLTAHLFPGIAELLVELRGLGARCFVVTNKPAAPAKLLLEHLGIAHCFEAVATPDDPVAPFSAKPAAVAALVRAKQIDSSTACVIGDAEDDAHGAHANQLAFIAAAYGYGEVHTQTHYPITHVAWQSADLPQLLTTALSND
ncbi:MAG: HAD family hydrolase, partial [Chthoniobacterales bacterium]